MVLRLLAYFFLGGAEGPLTAGVGGLCHGTFDTVVNPALFRWRRAGAFRIVSDTLVVTQNDCHCHVTYCSVLSRQIDSLAGCHHGRMRWGIW